MTRTSTNSTKISKNTRITCRLGMKKLGREKGGAKAEARERESEGSGVL